MPSPNERRRNNIRAGIFVIIAFLLAITVMVILTGVWESLARSTERYTVSFPVSAGVSNLQPGGEVRVGGVGMGSVVDVRECRDGPSSVESAAEEQIAAQAVVGVAPALEVEGFDALIVGCFGDPGLGALREVVTVPVVGPAQSSIHLAAQLGERFGILTVVEEVVPSLRRLVRSYEMASLMASLRAVEVPVLELRARRDEVLELLAREGAAAIEEGADALVLGCMTMGFLDVARELQERLEIPVVNPVLAALHGAETLVAAAAGSGGSCTRERTEGHWPG